MPVPLPYHPGISPRFEEWRAGRYSLGRKTPNQRTRLHSRIRTADQQIIHHDKPIGPLEQYTDIVSVVQWVYRDV